MVLPVDELREEGPQVGRGPVAERVFHRDLHGAGGDGGVARFRLPHLRAFLADPQQPVGGHHQDQREDEDQEQPQTEPHRECRIPSAMWGGAAPLLPHAPPPPGSRRWRRC